MKKIDMTDVQESKEFKRPKEGPFICKITGVIDHPTEEYLEIEYDFAEGEFAGYNSETRKAHPDWTWFGKYRQYYTEKSMPFFKAFCTSVSRSNGNYVFDAFKNTDEQTLVGKLIGLNFGEEKYDANDGTVKTVYKVRRTFSIDKLSEQTIPNPVDNTTKRPVTMTSDSLFVSPGVDEELPFA